MHVLFAVLLPVWLAAPPPGKATRLLPDEGGVLVATDRGLYRSSASRAGGGGGWDLVLARGAVHDLVAVEGGWLAAADGGLYESGEAGIRAHVLGAGARARSLATSGSGAVWVATHAGVFVRRDASAAFALETALPSGPAHAVRAVGDQLWVAREGELWVRDPGAGWRTALRGLGTGWWELVGAVPDEAGVLLAVPRGLWRIGSGDPRRIEHGSGELHALAAADASLFMASTRGLLRAPRAGLDSTVPELVVEGAAYDAVALADALLVSTRAGLARLPLRAAPRASAFRSPRVDPLDLQRAVIAYQGLSPSHMRRLEARARDAAWWPAVRLAGGWERDHARDEDRDQTFSSGEVRDLRDSARGRDTRFGFDLQLTWDLDRRAEPDDLLAISRERRELVELRDQVLERVNRLYFERRRLLEQSAAAPEAEAHALALRARELAAQLDGWTGGQFTRLEASSSSRNARSQP